MYTAFVTVGDCGMVKVYNLHRFSKSIQTLQLSNVTFSLPSEAMLIMCKSPYGSVEPNRGTEKEDEEKETEEKMLCH